MSTKKRVLALLEGSRGQSVSGEAIAKELSVSRNAVWKAIKELTKDGYRIEAATNRGYCLCDGNDILSAEGMLPFFTVPMSGKIFIHPFLESTNQTAKELALSGAAHGALVLAESQTAGRGRYGRQFHSPPGHGVYMSLVLQPAKLSLATPTLITAFAAVSVCEAIEAVCCKAPQIKWVNDIYLDGKKICGILTEAVTDFESNQIQWIVVGIGVNFSTPAAAFPEELRQTAGSLFPDGAPVTRNRLIAEIVNRVAAPKAGFCDPGELLRGYKKRLIMLGQRVQVTTAGESFTAVAMDVDDAGRLVVRMEDGSLRPLSAGEIAPL